MRGRRGPPTGREGAQGQAGFGAVHTGMCVQRDVTGMALRVEGTGCWYVGVGHSGEGRRLRWSTCTWGAALHAPLLAPRQASVHPPPPAPEN